MDSESVNAGSPAAAAMPDTNAQALQQGETGAPGAQGVSGGEAAGNGTLMHFVAIIIDYYTSKWISDSRIQILLQQMPPIPQSRPSSKIPQLPLPL